MIAGASAQPLSWKVDELLRITRIEEPSIETPSTSVPSVSPGRTELDAGGAGVANRPNEAVVSASEDDEESEEESDEGEVEHGIEDEDEDDDDSDEDDMNEEQTKVLRMEEQPVMKDDRAQEHTGAALRLVRADAHGNSSSRRHESQSRHKSELRRMSRSRSRTDRKLSNSSLFLSQPEHETAASVDAFIQAAHAEVAHDGKAAAATTVLAAAAAAASDTKEVRGRRQRRPSEASERKRSRGGRNRPHRARSKSGQPDGGSPAAGATASGLAAMAAPASTSSSLVWTASENWKSSGSQSSGDMWSHDESQKRNWPALLAAAYDGSTSKVRSLLGARADVNESSGSGDQRTPLYYAVIRDFPEVVRLLIRHPKIDVHRPMKGSQEGSWTTPAKLVQTSCVGNRVYKIFLEMGFVAGGRACDDGDDSDGWGEWGSSTREEDNNGKLLAIKDDPSLKNSWASEGVDSGSSNNGKLRGWSDGDAGGWPGDPPSPRSIGLPAWESPQPSSDGLSRDGTCVNCHGIELHLVIENIPVVSVEKGCVLYTQAAWLLQSILGSGLKAERGSLFQQDDTLVDKVRAECLWRGLASKGTDIEVVVAKKNGYAARAVGLHGKRTELIALSIALAMGGVGPDRETEKEMKASGFANQFRDVVNAANQLARTKRDGRR
eukprot:TRINITY_DN9168_c0_g1_i1.p1 TRINITY_DN9168_c0_g1~~TRINITY_DN9168_c0_g1_i1.p1  ORF type:complete len:733 (-),score=119.73 TRINITY_DN9168_c0_g1_i1:23-2014(-)